MTPSPQRCLDCHHNNVLNRNTPVPTFFSPLEFNIRRMYNNYRTFSWYFSTHWKKNRIFQTLPKKRAELVSKQNFLTTFWEPLSGESIKSISYKVWLARRVSDDHCFPGISCLLCCCVGAPSSCHQEILQSILNLSESNVFKLLLCLDLTLHKI